MDELIQQVSQHAGIPADKAKMAAEAVLSFLKTRLPAPIAGQLDSAISGNGGGLADAVKGLGGMFGSK